MLIDRIALLLTVVGGVNWGLIGLFRFDLVSYLAGGQGSTLCRAIFALIGLSAVWCVSLLFRDRRGEEPED
jgi:uncharacterized membrane protein YuzA (DUF378 family)